MMNSTNRIAELEAELDAERKKSMALAEILADRDARMRREGKLEALKALPKEAAFHLLLSEGLYAQGWNAYRDRVVSAIAALEKETNIK